MITRKHQQCFSFDAEPHDIKKCIKEGHRVLILMRGVTGSGKSFLANEFISLAEAHVTHSSKEDITKKVRRSVNDNIPLVSVDLVHAERPDIKKLAVVAIEEQYEVFVVEPQTDWKYDAVECQKRSTRGEGFDEIVEVIEKIKNSPITWEHLINGGNKNVEICNFHDDDLEFVTPSNSFNSSPQEKRLLSPKMFSLAPQQQTKIMRTCATQVTMDNIARSLADLPEIQGSGWFDMGVSEVPIAWNGAIRKETRCEQAPGPTKDKRMRDWDNNVLIKGSSDDLAFSILRSVFQNSDNFLIRHNLQVQGYEKTFQLMLALGEKESSRVIPTEDHILWEELEDEESFSISTMTVEEQMELLHLERQALKFKHDRCGPDTSNDEMIAVVLGAELNMEVEPEKTRQDVKNIKDLQLLFPDGASLMEGIYHDAGRDFEAARRSCRETYCLFEQPGVVLSKKTWSRKVAEGPISSPVVIKKTPTEMKNHFLMDKPTNGTLRDAQTAAFTIRQEMNARRLSQFASISTASTSLRNIAIQDGLRRLRHDAERKVGEIDKRLKAAHTNPWFIDLHYMSVDGAKALVNEAIEAVRYHMRAEKNISNRITVVTGCGNNSKHGARIKPEVETMLNRNGIRFDVVNAGCFKLKL